MVRGGLWGGISCVTVVLRLAWERVKRAVAYVRVRQFGLLGQVFNEKFYSFYSRANLLQKE